MVAVTIPNNWTPRPYQLPALEAFESGVKRFSLGWHRRAGKDSTSLNLASILCHMKPITVWHLFPLAVTCRRAIWRGMGADGVRFMDQAFPQAVRSSTRDQEMMIDLKCGSTYQMAGSDQYDSLVGSNPGLVIFSEYALADPQAWSYIRPIVRENNGIAVFISTFRGKNHMWRQHQMALKNDDWYAETLTVDDTTRHDGSPVLTPEDIQAERDEGMSEGMIQQEYYGSPMAAFEGSYWQQAMLKMAADKRITRVAYEPELPVYATMDLGLDDAMAAIFLQQGKTDVRVLGCRQWRNTSIPDVCADMRKMPWPVTHLFLPHDARIRDMDSAVSRETTFRNSGYTTTLVKSPPHSKLPGIEAGRNLLARTWIDADGPDNDVLIDALSGYRTEESKAQPGVFQLSPLHSWESHLADAWQCYAKSHKKHLDANKQPRDLSHQRKRAQRTPTYA